MPAEHSSYRSAAQPHDDLRERGHGVALVTAYRLSGGQRQRVVIARALTAEPDILLCDEVTSALDGDTAQAIMTVLDTLRAQRDLAVVVISHDVDLVRRHCTTALLLDHGRVAASGTAAQVLAGM